MLFAAIFVPNFIFQTAARCERELRMQPVAILEGLPPTYRVIALNGLAEKLGIVAGMTRANAEQFPHVQIRHRNKTQEEAAHCALLDAAWSISSRVEDAAPDTLLLDLDGLARLLGTPETIGQKIVSRASEIGMDVHVGISENVEAARIMARALFGVTVVPSGQERHFLESLPVRMLSPSRELAEIFERWGVTTCKSLASLPVLALSERAGQQAVHLHTLANGKGNRPLLITQPTDCFEECLELDDAVENLEPLSFLLSSLLQQLCMRICARALSVAVVHVTFTLEQAFESTTLSQRECNHPMETYSCSLKLPVPSHDPLLLLKLLRLRLQSKPPGAGVKTIYMRAEAGRSRAVQSGLFIPASPDPQKLELTLARIAAIVGEGHVGSPKLLDNHRPDAFHMQKFSVTTAEAFRPEEASETQTAFRVFRPPLPAWVQLQENVPARVAFQGMPGTVVHASGPWRTSGDWWNEEPWQQDAWDVEIKFTAESQNTQALYRIYYDHLLEKWWVRGVYD
jgi:protein ImuB